MGFAHPCVLWASYMWVCIAVSFKFSFKIRNTPDTDFAGYPATKKTVTVQYVDRFRYAVYFNRHRKKSEFIKT